MKNNKLKRRPRKTNSANKSSRSRSGGYSSGSSNRSSYRTRRSFNSRSRSRSRNRTNKSTSFDVERYINSINQAPKRNDTPVEKPVIKNAFADFKLPKDLSTSLRDNKFVTPTAIQDQAIPEILDRHDVVGIANTGTGKTLAFVLPLSANIINAKKKERVLIMTPTRELAKQVESEVAKITKVSPLNSVVCVGGMPIDRQIRSLKRNPEFVIGTPGRLKDLVDRRILKLDQFSAVVLDEADQMLDMGFINDMKWLLGHMPKKRQTLLFSATMSDDIKRLITDFTTGVKVISVKTRETASTVDQSVRKIGPHEDKFQVLVDLLEHDDTGKTIIFGRTKRGVDRLSRDLAQVGINADSIHGDKDQRRRTKVLNRFRSHSIRVLVATDVAARGLDIDDISHVINYDAPQTQEDYVHRIGRTGRAGKEGTAVTFV